MTQLSLTYAPADGQALKEAGVAKAEAADLPLADRVRAYLQELATRQPFVTVDDARAWMDERGLIAPSKYWYGCLWRGADWECVGFEPSKRPEKHAHANRRMRLRRTA